jgi:hypothetical protein
MFLKFSFLSDEIHMGVERVVDKPVDNLLK